MISNGEKQHEAKFEGGIAKLEGPRWHHVVVKKLSALLGGITSKHHGDFYCLSCLHSFSTEKKNLNHVEKYVKINIFATS